MALQKQFDRKLDDMWHRRSAAIRAHVRRPAGPVKQLSRKKRERGLNELVGLAEAILCRKIAKQRLDRATRAMKRKMLNEWGPQAKYDAMIDWAKRHIRGPMIYTFWRGNKCLYVGKGKSWRRLVAYRRDRVMTQATSVRVRMVESRKWLPVAECLSVHLFAPKRLFQNASIGR